MSLSYNYRNCIYILLLFYIVPLFFSCKSKEIVIPPQHQEISKINTYIANDDIEGLIRFYPNLLVHKDYAYYSCFSDFEIDKYTYEKVFNLYNLAGRDSSLHEGFGAILQQRENMIINSLLNKPIDEIADYYFEHPLQHRFLNSFIEESVMTNMEKMSYFEIKYMAHIFKETKFFDRLFDLRLKLKKNANKQIRKDIRDYIKSESESLNYLELSIRTYLLTYLYERYPLVINSIIDEDLPKNQNEILSLINVCVNKHISTNYIDGYVENEVSRYIQEINKARDRALSSLALQEIRNKNYLLQNKNNNHHIKIKFNPEPLYEISKIQNETDGWGVALSIASFLGSFMPGGILLDALDLGYGIHSEKKRSEKQIPYIKTFSEDFRIRMEKSVDSYVDGLMKDIKTNLKKSQNLFSSIYYELY